MRLSREQQNQIYEREKAKQEQQALYRSQVEKCNQIVINTPENLEDKTAEELDRMAGWLRLSPASDYSRARLAEIRRARLKQASKELHPDYTRFGGIIR